MDLSKKNSSNEQFSSEINIELIFKLPDGVEIPLTCKTDETIINLKKKLHDERGLEYNHSFFFKDQLLMDPLSLNDCKELIQANGGIIEVRLQ